ncbi:MAG: extensin family protein [bacterium]|nr:extensin family protein [bacterium]
MNCIDQHLIAKQYSFRTGFVRYCFPVLALTLFSALFVASPTSALAGPQFSIPGLQSLQRKFQKQRRHKKDRQQENSDEELLPLREDTLPSWPPPLPMRNPRFAETGKFLDALTLQEPQGQKHAPKAEQVMRTKFAKMRRTPLPIDEARTNDLNKATKTPRAGITPTRWNRPGNKQPQRLRKEPDSSRAEYATPRAAPVLTREVPTKPQVTTDLSKQDRLAISLPSVPPLPVRKPRRHPSQMAQEDWSAGVIASATTQCATLGIEIKPMPPIKKGLCGNPAPILLPVVGSATIRPAATTSCPMAANLARWFSQSVQPLALKHFGKKIQQIRNVSSYVCRNRYGDTNTRISEHAYANALDIAHFELQGGEKISVLNDWTSAEGEPSQKSAFLHAVHKSACEHFGTVLGPDANAAHKDHFHLDRAPRKHSSYCR